MKVLYKIIQYISIKVLSYRYNQLRKKYNIHPTFRFNGKDIFFYGGGKLIIKENTYIGGSSTIQIAENQMVEIGRGCRISHNVRMYTSSSVPDADFSKEVPSKCGKIIINDYVWIGANVFINPGIVIGENSVIGANSVVTKDIEPYSIYGGIPARLIRKKKMNV